jgi:glycosyltransferase involved in cell wall biosynthesis
MKILLSFSNKAFLNAGGGEAEIISLQNYLINHGLTSDLIGPDSKSVIFYDLIFHFSIYEDTESLIDSYILYKKKIILWPNIWWTFEPGHDEVLRIELIIKKVNKVVFKSKSEFDNFCKYISVDEHKVIIENYFIDFTRYDSKKLDLSTKYHNFNDYALCLGRIEPIKNQLEVIKTFLEIDKNLILIGGIGDANYFNNCKSIAKNNKNIFFFPFIYPLSPLLDCFISNSSLGIEISFDPPGKSAIELAYAKKPLVIKRSDWGIEIFNDNVYFYHNNNLDKLILDAFVDKEKNALKAFNHLSKNYKKNNLNDFLKCVVDD